MGDCGRAYGTGCVHEHSCLRCSLLRPDPAQRHRITEIRDYLLSRIAEAEREGRRGEMDGLKVSLTGAEQKLAQLTNGPDGPPSSPSACPPSATPPDVP